MPTATKKKATVSPAKKKAVQPKAPIAPATIELYDYDGITLITQRSVTPKGKETNFIDCVGRFIHDQKLNTNHILEKWDEKKRLITIIKTTGKSKSSGNVF
jgi:hypothetical protein